MTTRRSAADRAERLLEKVTAGLPEREARPQQVEMARAVAEAVAGGRPLVVRAGTGVGKSLAYLCGVVPSLRAGGTRLVVATATKALQDQLAGKDLPAVAEVEKDLTWAILKGRSNYLCRQAAAEASREADMPTLALGLDRTGIGAEVTKLLAWAKTTQTGDRAELDFEPRPAAWSSVSVGSEECPGAQACPSGPVCLAEAAYERAREADVVVVNLHLLGAHVASGGFILPEHDVVVVDEAHETEDVLSASLGVTLNPGRVAAVARLVPGSALVRHRDALDRALTPVIGRRLAAGAKGEPTVAAALGDLAQVVREERGGLRVAPDGEDADAKARRERAAKALDSLAADIDTVLGAADDFVTWVESSGASAVPSLRVAPVDVGEELASVLWSSATPILTSATIPPGISVRLGLADRAVELDVGSPFDYRTQSLLYVPRLSDVRHPKHEAEAHAELEFLIRAAGGRTLALFTSWRAMRAARAAMEAAVAFTVLGQDDLPKPALIEAFRTDETSCLFATMGFWQGVDVPGDACSLVVIDRLPFARPDDPVAEARRERAGPAAFSIVDVPQAAVRLAQGAGRLIRTATDRGVVAVLDPRLAEAAYRPAILAALPPMRRTRDRADVTTFFG